MSPIEITRNNLLNQKEIYSRTGHILPQGSFSLHDTGWGEVTAFQSASPFLAICPVSHLLETQIAVISQGWKHLATHLKPQHDSAWFNMTILGPDTGLEVYADQEDREPELDSWKGMGYEKAGSGGLDKNVIWINGKLKLI